MVGCVESALEIIGPLALGASFACYGVLSNDLTVGVGVTAGIALWQVAMIAVIVWKIATGGPRS